MDSVKAARREPVDLESRLCKQIPKIPEPHATVEIRFAVLELDNLRPRQSLLRSHQRVHFCPLDIKLEDVDGVQAELPAELIYRGESNLLRHSHTARYIGKQGCTRTSGAWRSKKCLSFLASGRCAHDLDSGFPGKTTTQDGSIQGTWLNAHHMCCWIRTKPCMRPRTDIGAHIQHGRWATLRQETSDSVNLSFRCVRSPAHSLRHEGRSDHLLEISGGNN